MNIIEKTILLPRPGDTVYMQENGSYSKIKFIDIENRIAIIEEIEHTDYLSFYVFFERLILDEEKKIWTVIPHSLEDQKIINFAVATILGPDAPVLDVFSYEDNSFFKEIIVRIYKDRKIKLDMVQVFSIDCDEDSTTYQIECFSGTDLQNLEHLASEIRTNYYNY